MLTNRFNLQFIKSKFSVVVKGLKNLLIFLKHGISSQKLKNLLNNILYFIFNLIKHPLIELANSKDS